MWQLAHFQEFRFEKSSRFLKSVFRSCKAIFNQNEISQKTSLYKPKTLITKAIVKKSANLNRKIFKALPI